MARAEGICNACGEFKTLVSFGRCDTCSRAARRETHKALSNPNGPAAAAATHASPVGISARWLATEADANYLRHSLDSQGTKRELLVFSKDTGSWHKSTSDEAERAALALATRHQADMQESEQEAVNERMQESGGGAPTVQLQPVDLKSLRGALEYMKRSTHEAIYPLDREQMDNQDVTIHPTIDAGLVDLRNLAPVSADVYAKHHVVYTPQLLLTSKQLDAARNSEPVQAVDTLYAYQPNLWAMIAYRLAEGPVKALDIYVDEETNMGKSTTAELLAGAFPGHITTVSNGADRLEKGRQWSEHVIAVTTHRISILDEASAADLTRKAVDDLTAFNPSIIEKGVQARQEKRVGSALLLCATMPLLPGGAQGVMESRIGQVHRVKTHQPTTLDQSISIAARSPEGHAYARRLLAEMIANNPQPVLDMAAKRELEEMADWPPLERFMFRHSKPAQGKFLDVDDLAELPGRTVGKSRMQRKGAEALQRVHRLVQPVDERLGGKDSTEVLGWENMRFLIAGRT